MGECCAKCWNSLINKTNMVSIFIEPIVQLPDRSTFSHPRRINLSSLFINRQISIEIPQLPISPSKNLHLTSSSQTFPLQLCTLILSIAQILPSKPTKKSFVSKNTWLTINSSVSILRYFWFTEPSSDLYILFG